MNATVLKLVDILPILCRVSNWKLLRQGDTILHFEWTPPFRLAKIKTLKVLKYWRNRSRNQNLNFRQFCYSLIFWSFIKRNNYGKVAQPWSGKPYLLSFLPKHATSKLAKMKTLKVPDSVYSTMTSGHGTEEVRHCTKKTFAHNRKERKRERSVTRSIC